MSKRSSLISILLLLCFIVQITKGIRNGHSHRVPPPPPPPPAPAAPLPPPPPSFGVKTNAQSDKSRLLGKKQTVEKRKFQWTKIPEKIDLSKTIFSNMTKVNINESEIEKFFFIPLNTGNSEKNKTVKISVVKFLESIENIKVSVAMKNLPSISAIQKALETMNNTILTPENVKSLKSIFITKEQLKKFNEVKDPKANWDIPELFLVELNKIPNALAKLRIWEFLNGFYENYNMMIENAQKLQKGIKEFKENSFIKKCISMMLHIGNFLNKGLSQFGNAKGFTIEFLSKITDLRGINQTSAMEFILGKIREEEKEKFPFSEKVKTKDLYPNIFAAANIMKSNLDSTNTSLFSGFEAFKKDLNSLNQEDVFVTKAKQLKKKIQEDLTKGKQALSDVDTEFQKLLEYFPSTKKETTIEDYFAPIQVFLNNVDVVVNQIIGKEKKKEKLEKEKKSPPKKANNKKLPEFSHDDLQVQIKKGVHLKKVDTVVKTGLPTKQQKN